MAKNWQKIKRKLLSQVGKKGVRQKKMTKKNQNNRYCLN